MKCLGRGWQCQKAGPLVCHGTPDAGTVHLTFPCGTEEPQVLVPAPSHCCR